MALKQNIITSIGIPATFWLIPKVELDYNAKQGLITMYGYASREHSDQPGGSFLERIYINVYPKCYQFDQYFDLYILKEQNISQIDMAYRFVKENVAIFKTATDLIYDIEGNLIGGGPGGIQ